MLCRGGKGRDQCLPSVPSIAAARASDPATGAQPVSMRQIYSATARAAAIGVKAL